MYCSIPPAAKENPENPEPERGYANQQQAGKRASHDSKSQREARTRAWICLIQNSRGLELFHATKERISPVKRAYKYHPCSGALLRRSNIPVKETIPPSKQLCSSLFRCQTPLHFMFIFPICFVLNRVSHQTTFLEEHHSRFIKCFC